MFTISCFATYGVSIDHFWHLLSYSYLRRRVEIIFSVYDQTNLVVFLIRALIGITSVIHSFLFFFLFLLYWLSSIIDICCTRTEIFSVALWTALWSELRASVKWIKSNRDRESPASDPSIAAIIPKAHKVWNLKLEILSIMIMLFQTRVIHSMYPFWKNQKRSILASLTFGLPSTIGLPTQYAVTYP